MLAHLVLVQVLPSLATGQDLTICHVPWCICPATKRGDIVRGKLQWSDDDTMISPCDCESWFAALTVLGTSYAY